MKIDIITLFPEMFSGPFEHSIIKRAQEKNIAQIKIYNLRRWAIDKTAKLSSTAYKHGTVDDKPYGGGVGMVLMIEPIYRALEALKLKVKSEKFPSRANQPLTEKVILLDPAGIPFNQLKAQELSNFEHLILIAGHYEGVDERVKDNLIDEEISIGDYVLTGGELPAMVVVDAVVRLIQGVLEKPEATQSESFSPIYDISIYRIQNQMLLEYPQYTRPEEFMDWKVPEILLSGNHKEIEKWKKEKAIQKTKKIRPDLLK